MTILDWIIGSHLSIREDKEQRIGTLAGIPTLGLDALASAAYGPEAALTVLLPLGLMSSQVITPLLIGIVVLLFLVFLSYSQTIRAYPGGGGSYTVAKSNLGKRTGVVAAAALLLDYVLNVAVGISAGVGALISAVPLLKSYTLSLCFLILVLLMIVNLRGVKESGKAFLVPTYGFVFSLFTVITIGAVKALFGHIQPPAPALSAQLATTGEALSFWLILRAFASGCTAMTGVEAVSNGTKIFREPIIKNSLRTLVGIVFILILLLLGIGFLCHSFHIVATHPGTSEYESVLSQIVRAVIGRGFAYYLTMGSVIGVLCLSANTSFADFPRVCEVVAKDHFLPKAFSERGRRLVFSNGILVLSAFAGLLLWIFGGITDRLIPLFAIGAFLSFTLSQAGMVAHWMRSNDRNKKVKLLLNALGAIFTGATTIVALVAKFKDGAWVTVLVLPILYFLMTSIRRHYFWVQREVHSVEPLEVSPQPKVIAVVPIRGWNRITRKALRFALQISDQVFAVHAKVYDRSDETLLAHWEKYVTQPSRAAGVKPPELVPLSCQKRRLFYRVMGFIDNLNEAHPNCRVALIVPDLIENHWYHFLLHNQRAARLKAAALFKRHPNVIVMTVPWFVGEGRENTRVSHEKLLPNHRPLLEV